MSRKSSRKHAFTIIYQFPFHQPLDAREIMDAYLAQEPKISGNDCAFVNALVIGTAEVLEELDSIIAKYAVGWGFDRISKIDLAIMRLSIFEIRHMDDVPVGVAINEAVELAKEYGTDDSPTFINGLLARVARERGEQ